jgi:cysteine-rich repeat protein
MVGVAARSGWAVGGGLVLALACGGKAASSDGVFDEPGAGGEGGEATGAKPGATGGPIPVTGGAPVASGGTSAAGEAAAGAHGGDEGGGGAPGPSVCGNGIVEEPEECDDGNASNEDLCTNQCRAARCGDGYVQPGEQCDGPDCNEFCFRDSLSACGDGRVDPGEECDDGNRSETDTCSNDCKPTLCLDGIRQAGEECDDGNANNNDDCLNDCTLPTCGDGILHNLGTGREICDDGEDNSWEFSASCSPECTFDHSCFDGEWQPERGEECDDDFKADTSSCTLGCLLNFCGDGYAYLDETPGTNNTNPLHECDDANEDDTDACTSECAWNVCGDGFVFSQGYGAQYDDADDGNELDDNPNPVEECDDGNDEAGDGCFVCQLED